jgi:hypothetical protein
VATLRTPMSHESPRLGQSLRVSQDTEARSDRRPRPQACSAFTPEAPPRRGRPAPREERPSRRAPPAAPRGPSRSPKGPAPAEGPSARPHGSGPPVAAGMARGAASEGPTRPPDPSGLQGRGPPSVQLRTGAGRPIDSKGRVLRHDDPPGGSTPRPRRATPPERRRPARPSLSAPRLTRRRRTAKKSRKGKGPGRARPKALPPPGPDGGAGKWRVSTESWDPLRTTLWESRNSGCGRIWAGRITLSDSWRQGHSTAYTTRRRD